jgi:NAD(P)-dependent dehydrogenase (short-subunit alcohol dehydrogenase family)
VPIPADRCAFPPTGGRAVVQHADVSSEPEIRSAIERAVTEYGRLDIMFDSAGLVGAVGSIEAAA